jgi:cytochrome P450
MANTQLPNGPQQPRILQLMQWIANPLRYLDTCAGEYGDVFTLRPASFNPLVFLSHPQAIQEIFSADANTLTLVEPMVLYAPWWENIRSFC